MDSLHSILGGKHVWWTVLWTAFVLCSSFLLAQGQLSRTTSYDISITVSPPETLEGQTVNLTIKHEGSNFVLCNWYRGNEVKENLIFTLYLLPILTNTTGASYTGREVAGWGCSLLIRNLNVNDSGTYMVTMSGPSVAGSGLVNIQVLGQHIKQISITVSTPETLEGRTVNLTIKHEGSNFVLCNWYRGNDVKENLIFTLYLLPNLGNTTGASYTGREVAGWGCSLLIRNLNVNDSGTYVVTMSGPSVAGRGLVNIQVLGCVHEVTINRSLEGTEGEPVSLTCTAEGDNIAYTWWKGGQPVNENERIRLTDKGQTLIFSPCDRRDAAQYTCNASNSYSSSASKPFGLGIIYGPDPPFINETIDISRETISLTCVAVAYPPTVNQWFFNGQPVLDGPVLTRNIIAEHSGNYSCQAKNPRSEVTRKTNLEIDMIGTLRRLRRR